MAVPVGVSDPAWSAGRRLAHPGPRRSAPGHAVQGGSAAREGHAGVVVQDRGPAALVHRTVVCAAQERQVREHRRPAVDAVVDVVRLADVHGTVTRGEAAPAVAGDQRRPQRRGHPGVGLGGAQHAGSVGQHRPDRRVAREPPRRSRRQAGRRPILAPQQPRDGARLLQQHAVETAVVEAVERLGQQGDVSDDDHLGPRCRRRPAGGSPGGGSDAVRSGRTHAACRIGGARGVTARRVGGRGAGHALTGQRAQGLDVRRDAPPRRIVRQRLDRGLHRGEGLSIQRGDGGAAAVQAGLEQQPLRCGTAVDPVARQIGAGTVGGVLGVGDEGVAVDPRQSLVVARDHLVEPPSLLNGQRPRGRDDPTDGAPRHHATLKRGERRGHVGQALRGDQQHARVGAGAARGGP